MTTAKRLIRILSLTLLLSTSVIGQDQITQFELPKTNSRAVIQQRVAATDIEVTYNRPSVKGRRIFGELVPYGQVWRTGADESTKISFSTPVSINGTPIEAGTYELFTIPNAAEWIVILQENRSQWGSYSYQEEFDVARIAATPSKTKNLVETFTFSFDDVETDATTLNISWENVRVPVQLTIDISKTVVPQIEAALSKEGKRPYFRAAMFYFENNLDIDRAAELMELALEGQPNHLGMLYRLALILERKGDIEGAISASERSLKATSSASKELLEEYTRLNNHLLSRLRD